MSAPGSVRVPIRGAASAYEALDLLNRAAEAVQRCAIQNPARDQILTSLDKMQLTIAAVLSEGEEVVKVKL